MDDVFADFLNPVGCQEDLFLLELFEPFFGIDPSGCEFGGLP
ncbi:hypothetical protein ACFVAV_13435 [Nocardia sp. NPDC057663]